MYPAAIRINPLFSPSSNATQPTSQSLLPDAYILVANNKITQQHKQHKRSLSPSSSNHGELSSAATRGQSCRQGADFATDNYAPCAWQ